MLISELNKWFGRGESGNWLVQGTEFVHGRDYQKGLQKGLNFVLTAGKGRNAFEKSSYMGVFLRTVHFVRIAKR
jgi:hypothetical protein